MQNTPTSPESPETYNLFAHTCPDEVLVESKKNDPGTCAIDSPGVHIASQIVLQQPQATAYGEPSRQALETLVSKFNQRRYIEAGLLARSLTESFPHHGFGWTMLGVTLNQMGRSAEALLPMQKAVTLLPDDADAHYNLGITLHALGRLGDAETSYRRALYIRPNFVEALNQLALLFDASGNLVMALNISIYSLQIRETQEAKSIFFNCAKRLRCTHGGPVVKTYLVRALTEPWGRPGELMQFSTDLVRLDPDIGGCVTRAVKAWPVHLSAQNLFEANSLGTLANDKLLCALLGSAPICDSELERFLTMARHAMLETATAMTSPEADVNAALSFYSALARQCFINEYVFSVTDAEIRQASDLRDSLAAALEAGTQTPVLCLLAVAAYFPLCSISLAARLLDTQWPDAVAAVLIQQVCEPAEELELCASIPRLTGIEDDVSRLVQNQYEENPYPRWVRTAPAGRAENIIEYLDQKFPLAPIERQDKCDNPDILIAGCGTGQHSIQSTQQFHGAQVLAIDLSITSLGYAGRKTRELGLTSIEYAQADIMKLGSLGRSFDVIESVGVLHHLADPWAGWKVLLSLLRPGGFMKLGFYSEMARRNIINARAFIDKKGYGATASEIRWCRQELVDLGKSADFWTAFLTRDFFSISACRDMLFHVQEHRMTLPGIEAFLRDNNLVLLGFEIGAEVIHAYKQRFPDDHAATNLEQWQIFENENPGTFYGMYQFWIQKPG
ncbi:MAG: methyltransferase domain-containing protein [Nitrosomonadales bacterium]|nr:methyltransferase domain-containing protein [Nitrosomonadales bacterium]